MGNAEKLATLGTQIQRNWQHWVHKCRETGNIGYTNPEKLTTLGTQM
jgi:hypothetical protein